MKHIPRIRITDLESRLTDSERVSLWGNVRTHMIAHPLPIQKQSALTLMKSPFVIVAPFARPLLSVTLIVLLAFGSTTTVTWAAQAAMPGETLYTVKIASEQLRERFALSPNAKVAIAALRAERRLAEAALLKKQRRLTTDIESSLQASFTEHVTHITETLADEPSTIPLPETASAIARIEAQLGAMEADDNIDMHESMTAVASTEPSAALMRGVGLDVSSSLAVDAGVVSSPEIALMSVSDNVPTPAETTWAPFIDIARATIETHEDVLRMQTERDFDGIPDYVSSEIDRVRTVYVDDERVQALIDVVEFESEEKDPIEVLKDIAVLEVNLEHEE